MKGALIFLATFFLVAYLTTTNPAIPPGKDLYTLLNVPEVDYPVMGYPLTTLVIAVLNGIVYGIVIYIIYVVYSRLSVTKNEEVSKENTIIKQVMDEEPK